MDKTKKRFSAVKVGKRVLHDIYFNAKKRNKIKKGSLKIQKTILENVDSTVKPVLKEEYEERETYSSWLYMSTTFLKTVKDAEDLKYRTTLKKCSFQLYKSKKTKTVIIENKFFKVCEGKNKTTVVVFPNGLPYESKRRCRFYKNGYEFNKDDYEMIDSGKFKQKILDFSELSVSFKGKVFNKKIVFKQISESNEHHWAKLADNIYDIRANVMK